MTKATDQVEAAAQVLGAELVPLSALLSLPSGFYDGRWIESDTLAALVDECVRMAPPQAQPADALDAAVAALEFNEWIKREYPHLGPIGDGVNIAHEAWNAGRAAMAAAQETPPAPADLWYLQDTRGYVGNDVSWWAKDGNGYTTDVSKAHIYTRADAFKQAAMRGCDRAWPKAYIDGKTRPAVDMQYIDHHAAMAAAQEGGKA